jgi:hypothetical protein
MYIKGMLNNPDLQPNAAINRWIQGILMFDFKLIHVPAERHKGPDALSRRTRAEGEEALSDDDSWLDNIALLTFFPEPPINPFPTLSETLSPPESQSDLPSCLASRISQEQLLNHIRHFLETLETPKMPTPQKKRRFLAKAAEFFMKEEKLFRRNGDHPPLLVIFDPIQKLTILKQAHENLGHRGVQSVFELLRHRFFWPHI